MKKKVKVLEPIQIDYSKIKHRKTLKPEYFPEGTQIAEKFFDLDKTMTYTVDVSESGKKRFVGTFSGVAMQVHEELPESATVLLIVRKFNA